MTQCVVLDGWHKGHVVTLPGAPETITLMRPAVTTWCACNSDGEEESSYSEPGRDEYKRCLAPVDGKVAAYSVKGDSEALLNGRDWVTSAKRDAWVARRPLYDNITLDVNCRDERAWP